MARRTRCCWRSSAACRCICRPRRTRPCCTSSWHRGVQQRPLWRRQSRSFSRMLALQLAMAMMPTPRRWTRRSWRSRPRWRRARASGTRCTRTRTSRSLWWRRWRRATRKWRPRRRRCTRASRTCCSRSRRSTRGSRRSLPPCLTSSPSTAWRTRSVSASSSRRRAPK